jgi:hypothetical protein
MNKNQKQNKKCKCQKEDTTDVTMSVPEGFEYNKAYSIDSLATKSKYYWEINRNGLQDNSNSDHDIDKQSINPNFSWHLDKVVERITKLLKEKNAAYGNSALKPLNTFSKLDAIDSLCSRIDDKLARISNKGITDDTEDTVDDLIGYLLLLKMAMDKKKGTY